MVHDTEQTDEKLFKAMVAFEECGFESKICYNRDMVHVSFRINNDSESALLFSFDIAKFHDTAQYYFDYCFKSNIIVNTKPHPQDFDASLAAFIELAQQTVKIRNVINNRFENIHNNKKQLKKSYLRNYKLNRIKNG